MGRYQRWVWSGEISLLSAERAPATAEPLNDNGTMRADVFYNTLNTSYINIALQTAHAADPNAKLYINEYNLEYTGKLKQLPHCDCCDDNECLPRRSQDRCHGPTC